MSSFSFKDRLRKSYKSLSPGNKYTYKTVEEWLDNMELANYKPLFKKYKNVEDLLKLSESSLKRLGIKNGVHRARMMSNINLLRDAAKKSGIGSAVRLERLKQEAGIPRSIYKLMFHSNKALTSPVGIVPSLGLPSTRDLEGVNWYHGMISRLEAETLVMKEGDFLVRDSSSHPGELVLTSYKENKPMHFVINCIEYQKGSHGVSEKFYKFDAEAFPSITSLITYHLESGKPITLLSGIVLLCPVPSLKNNVIIEKIQDTMSDDQFDKWTGSQPLLSLGERSPMRGSSSLVESLERCGSMPSMFKNPKFPLNNESPLSNGSIERLGCENKRTLGNRLGDLDNNSFSSTNDGSSNSQQTKTATTTIIDCEQLPLPPDFLLTSPTSHLPSIMVTDQSTKVKPPPKPSRVPTLRFNEASFKPMVKIRNNNMYDDESDDEKDDQNVEKSSLSSSLLDAAKDHHTFLPPNNKPLDPSVTSDFTSRILGTPAGTIARHITYIDIEILQIIPSNHHELNLTSGLELLTLPQGHCLRQNAIERHHCMRMFVSAIILKGQSTRERCDLISHWLSVAMELKTNTGNIFSFYSIMDALCSSQLVRLKGSWKLVKSQHGTIFEIFETKLLPSYRTLLDASGLTFPHQRDTITPHVFPLLELLERPPTLMEDEGVWKLGSWELNQPFFGLDVILVHLETARLITGRMHLYRDATERFLASNSSSSLDSNLLGILDPRVQVKFLWGSKGELADRSERLAKFDHLLSLLSEVVEKDAEG